MACTVIHPRKGVLYYLHSKQAFRNTHSIYWFSSDERGAIDLPKGYEVSFNWKTKQPIVRKIRRLS